MPRRAAAVLLVVLVTSACSQATGSGSSTTSPPRSTPSTTSTSPTTSASDTSSAPSAPAALSIPTIGKGEVSRSVLKTGAGAPSSNTSTIGDPVGGREYVVRSACIGEAPDVTITYRLVDARASSSDRSLDERTVMSSQAACDGNVHVDGVGPLDFPVTVDYGSSASGVTTAYTIVAPG